MSSLYLGVFIVTLGNRVLWSFSASAVRGGWEGKRFYPERLIGWSGLTDHTHICVSLWIVFISGWMTEVSDA